jgi:hypothetical protein
MGQDRLITIIRSGRMGHDLRPAIAPGGISIFSRIPDPYQPLQVRSARKCVVNPDEAISKPSSLNLWGSEPVRDTAESRFSAKPDYAQHRPRILSETILPN